jgi:zinc D-Ala-D-Ala carboxypeptidase
MIKWITSYFQNKADARKNIMVPTRQPKVKINLKKINFQNSVFTKRKQGRQPTPDISSSFVDVSPKVEPKPTQPTNFFNGKVLPSKEAPYKEKLHEKLYEREDNWGSTRVLFVLAILFCIVSALTVIASGRSGDRQATIDKCNTSFREAVNRGLDLEGVNCATTKGVLAYFKRGEASAKLDAVAEKISTQESNIKNTQETLDKEIADTINYLSFFNVEKNRFPDEPIPAQSTNDDITNKQQYLNQLKTLLQKETGTLNETLNSYLFLIDSNPTIDLSNERKYYNDYLASSDEDKYKNYQELTIKYAAMIEKVTKTQDNKFVATGLSDKSITEYKFYNGEEFKQQWYRVNKPNTSTLKDVTITNDNAADQRLIKIATDRGYQLQMFGDAGKLVSVGNELLQPDTAKAFEELQQAATKDGINIGLVSGFRSPDTQRGIFLSRFASASISQGGKEFDVRQIAAGEADSVIDSVLKTSSIPGYSKHHTGYAIDIQDNNSKEDFTQFINTKAFDWISANNYYNAKKHGFIPSYPEGATNQGPDPESWEYLYVGIDNLKK